MELRSQGPLRNYNLPGGIEVERIMLYGNGQINYTADRGWLEHHAIGEAGKPSSNPQDVKMVNVEGEIVRAIKVNLDRTDNFYTKGKGQYTRGGVDLYIYAPVTDLGLIEMSRDRYAISLGQFYQLDLSGMFKDWDGATKAVSGIVVRTAWNTAETDEGKAVSAFVGQLQEAGIRMEFGPAARLLDFYTVKPKDLDVQRKIIAQEVFDKTMRQGDLPHFPIEETGWSRNQDTMSQSYKAENIETGEKLGICGFSVNFEPGSLKVASVEQSGPRR